MLCGSTILYTRAVGALYPPPLTPLKRSLRHYGTKVYLTFNAGK